MQLGFTHQLSLHISRERAAQDRNSSGGFGSHDFAPCVFLSMCAVRVAEVVPSCMQPPRSRGGARAFVSAIPSSNNRTLHSCFIHVAPLYTYILLHIAFLWPFNPVLCAVAGSTEPDLMSSGRGRHGAQGGRGFALDFSSGIFGDLKLEQVRSRVHFISVLVSVCLCLSV